LRENSPLGHQAILTETAASMSTTTPAPRRTLGRPRPSLGNQALSTASSPNLASSFQRSPANALNNKALPRTPGGGGDLSPHALIARKASLSALTSNSLSTVPDSSAGYGLSTLRESGNEMHPVTPLQKNGVNGDPDVNDLVDVPGGMYGTVKFVGAVKGKKGVFAGVELAREWASRGKNDGDVDGCVLHIRSALFTLANIIAHHRINYFQTSVPNSGIFLPISRATKRNSPGFSSSSSPPLTPTTPSLGGFGRGNSSQTTNITPPTPSFPNFSQSVGPGVRAQSPQLKGRGRPSLPRPGSPLRGNPLSTPSGRPSISGPTPSRGLGGGFAPSPSPAKFGASLRNRNGSIANGDPGKKSLFGSKAGTRIGGPPSRAGSAMSNRGFDEEANTTPIGVARTSDNYDTTPRAGGDVDNLRRQLEERDKQLKEQASSLSEMENSLVELQALLPQNGEQDQDAADLRRTLREKNEKISLLTSEFDAHRADFRSTIDTLEMASTETARVYEIRVGDLEAELREMHERGEDVDSVAQQLKQLEELVQELEEGLEDARRGEAEARGEVEFLRGEVERGRSELRRERDKAAAALKGAGAVVDGGGSPGGAKEVEQRDDEIRGLKAIIHSLSRDAIPDASSPLANGKSNGTSTPALPTADELAREKQSRERLERQVRELEGMVDRKTYREEELERELERIRKGNQRASAGTLGSNATEKTLSGKRDSRQRENARDSKGTVVSWRNRSPEDHHGLETMNEADTPYSSDADSSTLWCEICETGGHDILTCTNMFGNNGDKVPANGSPTSLRRTGREAVAEGLKGMSTGSPALDHKVATYAPSTNNKAQLSPIASVGTDHASPTPVQPNPHDASLVAGKATGVVDPDKWCALCERDGHESVDCPFDEDAF
jgi:CAP-Gly domain/CLIP1 zinc knuckle